MDHFAYITDPSDPKTSALRCEGVDIESIAREVGTPTYVYSSATISTHLQRIEHAWAPLRPSIHYAVKACSNLHVLRLMVERGAGLDVVSGGELERAFLAGCPMDRVAFAGVGKSESEIRAALDPRHSPLASPGVRSLSGVDVLSRGPVGRIHIESEPELERVARIAHELGVTATCSVRVNPGVDARTHAYTTTARPESKFGVDPEAALRIFRRAHELASIRLDGLHMHLGSPIYDFEPYESGIGAMRELIDRIERAFPGGQRIGLLNIGGGFAADYETGRAPSAHQYAERLVPLLAPLAERGVAIAIEPGRTIVASAGVLLTRVQYVKRTPSRVFLVCDAGMHTLVRPALYGSFHFVWPARVDAGLVPARRAELPDLADPARARELVGCDVVGPVCESSDFLARGRRLPEVSEGELLAVFTAGAYGMTMSSNYNDHPRPAEVLVEGDAHRVIRRRQSALELFAPELD